MAATSAPAVASLWVAETGMAFVERVAPEGRYHADGVG